MPPSFSNAEKKILWHPALPALLLAWFLYRMTDRGLSLTGLAGILVCIAWLVGAIKSSSRRPSPGYVKLCCRWVLDGATASIGLKRIRVKPDASGAVGLADLVRQPLCPPVYLSDEYHPLNFRNNGIHIVIGREVEVHEPGSDFRQASSSVRTFKAYRDAVGYLVERQMAVAAQQSMSRDPRFIGRSDRRMSEEDSRIWLELHAEHRAKIEGRLQSYLRSPLAKLACREVDKELKRRQ